MFLTAEQSVQPLLTTEMLCQENHSGFNMPPLGVNLLITFPACL